MRRFLFAGLLGLASIDATPSLRENRAVSSVLGESSAASAEAAFTVVEAAAADSEAVDTVYPAPLTPAQQAQFDKDYSKVVEIRQDPKPKNPRQATDWDNTIRKYVFKVQDKRAILKKNAAAGKGVYKDGDEFAFLVQEMKARAQAALEAIAKFNKQQAEALKQQEKEDEELEAQDDKDNYDDLSPKEQAALDEKNAKKRIGWDPKPNPITKKKQEKALQDELARIQASRKRRAAKEAAEKAAKEKAAKEAEDDKDD